jgi:hypothetical protein
MSHNDSLTRVPVLTLVLTRVTPGVKWPPTATETTTEIQAESSADRYSDELGTEVLLC